MWSYATRPQPIIQQISNNEYHYVYSINEMNKLDSTPYAHVARSKIANYAEMSE